VTAGGTEMHRRTLLASAGALAATQIGSARADAPGITSTEIKIGNTGPHSGAASAYGVYALVEAAYFRMINDKGGINGRKITFMSLDDAYSPPRTVEQTRRLVEAEEVAFIFNGLGTPTQSAVHHYLNNKKVPQLFVMTGADKFADPEHFPWTIAYPPTYRTEAAIWAKFLLAEKPDAKIGILYQNDDLGKDYLTGLHNGLGEAYDKMVVKIESYETTAPTIDSQIVSLQSSGADTLLTAAIAKWATQSIRRTADLGWKPLHLMSAVSVSAGAVINPAAGEGGRHDRRHLRQGQYGSTMGGRSGHEGVACVHEAVSARSRPERHSVRPRLRCSIHDGAGAEAVRR
jgi:branched-chain amino acid transport system substrate-binding protein